MDNLCIWFVVQFQHLWKIWLRQLGWWFPTERKNKKCSKPPTRNWVNWTKNREKSGVQQATWEILLIQIHDKSWEFLPKNGDSLTDSWWLQRLGVLVPSAFRTSGSVWYFWQSTREEMMYIINTNIYRIYLVNIQQDIGNHLLKLGKSSYISVNHRTTWQCSIAMAAMSVYSGVSLSFLRDLIPMFVEPSTWSRLTCHSTGNMAKLVS